MVKSDPLTPSVNRKAMISHKLVRLDRNISVTDEALHGTREEIDVSLVESHREQLVDCKKELAAIYEDLLALDLEDGDELFTQHARLEKIQFGCSHKARQLLGSLPVRSVARPSVEGEGVKLPKLDVPTFDGDILNWRQFWEQYTVSVHARKNLSDAEKLVYLQQAIKKGSAGSTIEGLSRSGYNYSEAIECLKSRYDRPRFIHHTHVQRIIDASNLKDGSGKELRRDTVATFESPENPGSRTVKCFRHFCPRTEAGPKYDVRMAEKQPRISRCAALPETLGLH